ncbi:uncharacterized protein LOC132612228 [Lycium barbarum]|uniref:uncharacterized protein LOC132612228 n=1 Tax=Lycium barbarum TaxID=112863 RepID=UPI00293E8D65|nr:uncharacterized protein LOC132612228 [Lycium barbarum]
MTNDTEPLATSRVSSMPLSDSTPVSRTSFHPDDYTHPCHPLYVHPSDVLGSSLVPVPFDGNGYSNWRRTILVALFVRNKLDFIKNISDRPPETSPLARQWQRCNDLVVSWLINFLQKDIARSVEYSELAKDIWGELEEKYGQANGGRVFELKKELSHISQGPLDIASYFNKIKQLWDEIGSISISHCSCGGSKKSDDEQKVYQFLMGLNDTYIQVRSNILMMKPLPTVSTVYSILLADEKQRHISSTSQFSSSSASFHAGTPTFTNYPGSSSSYPGPSRPHFPSKVNFDSQKSSLICKYYKRPGHSIDKCYRLHGFPPNFEFTKTNGPRKSAAHVELDTSHDNSGGSGCSAGLGGSNQAPVLPGLTQEQHSQLLSLQQ